MKPKSIGEIVFLKVRKAISDFALAEPGDRILVAVSGGPDSTALLLVLKELSDELNISLGVFHLNHMLREGAEADENFVKELSRKLSLRCFIFKEDVSAVAKAEKISLEEAGRKVRYRLMEETAKSKGFNRVALGHTLSDVAETVVMRLISHSNFEALKGIPPKRGIFIRPLIYVSRSEVVSYLESTGQIYCLDETNANESNIRSVVRNRIMPVIKQLNPSFEEKALELAKTVSDFSELLEELAKKETERLTYEREGAYYLDAEEVLKIHPVIARKVVYEFLVKAGLNRKKITSQAVEKVLHMYESGPKAFDLSKDLRAILYKNSIKIERKHQARTLPEVELVPPGKVRFPEFGAEIKVELLDKRPEELGDGKILCVLDAKKVGKKVIIRGFKPGDRMVPLGMQSEKKVHDIFIDEKVPKEKRQCIPMVVAENGKICWIPTLKVSEEFKVDENTEVFYRFSYLNTEGKKNE